MNNQEFIQFLIDFNDTPSDCWEVDLDSLDDFQLKKFCAALAINSSHEHLVLIRTTTLESNSARSNLLIEALKTNKTLKILQISDNALTDKSVEWIAKILQTNSSLIELNISNNNITQEGAKLIAQALRENNSPKVLDMSCNKIGDEGAAAIADVLETNTTLEALNISDNEIACDGVDALAITLCTHNKTLKSLNINKNVIGTASYRLADFLRWNTSLVSLDISFMANKNHVEQLIQALLDNDTLEELNISGNVLSLQEIRLLAHALQHNKSLKSLKIAQVGLDSTNINLLIPALEFSNLKYVNMQSNEIGDKGAELLATALLKNHFLEGIDITQNGINAKGADSIADVLRTENSSLKIVNMELNSIGSDGAEALADALTANTVLTNLILNSGVIGSAGAIALAKCLLKNTSLQNLSLFNNRIHDKGARSFLPILAKNKNMQINITSNPITKETKAEFATLNIIK